jgi:hypothetical protein
VVENGDTVLVSTLKRQLYTAKTYCLHPRSPAAQRLIYNVKKVYPYAKLAGEKFAVVNA